MSKYLEENGLRYFWHILKEKFDHLKISKMDEPENEGPYGYVLMSDGNGGRGWGKFTGDTQTSLFISGGILNIEKASDEGIRFVVFETTLNIDT